MTRVVVAALFVLVALPAAASAQRPGMAVGATAGSGVSIGAGQGESVVLRSPIFLDVSLRTWSDERPDLLLGGSLRMEIDGRASVAAVPRAELVYELGALSLRPGVGVPFFFAPFSMLGIEASMGIRLKIAGGFAVIGSAMVDAYFVGSDVPDGSIVVMINGAAGVELTL